MRLWTALKPKWCYIPKYFNLGLICWQANWKQISSPACHKPNCSPHYLYFCYLVSYLTSKETVSPWAVSDHLLLDCIKSKYSLVLVSCPKSLFKKITEYTEALSLSKFCKANMNVHLCSRMNLYTNNLCLLNTKLICEGIGRFRIRERKEEEGLG